MTFKPTLACDADLTKVKLPLLLLPKIDGVRGVVRTSGLVGRSLKPFKNRVLTGTLSRPELLGLDGELVYGSITAEGACRTTTSAVNTIKGDVFDMTFNVFDDASDPTLPYAERYFNAHCRVLALPDDLKHYVKIVPCSVVETVEHIENTYSSLLAEGYEGVILRDPAAAYKYGRATLKEGSYLRIKPSADDEAVVLSLEEAEANNNEATINELGHTERSSHQDNKEGKGMVGALICRDIKTGNEIKVGAGKLTHEERVYYWLNHNEIVGKVIKYRHLTVGVKDKPRHARFIGFRAEEDMSS